MNKRFGGEIIGHGKWKLIFILSILSILLISAAYATDDVILEENGIAECSQDNLLINDQNDLLFEDEDSFTTSNDRNIDMKNHLSDNDDDFGYIQKVIDDADDGGSIYLENKTYKGNGTPLNISKNLNIYGYQYQSNINTVLDGDSKSSIFIVNDDIQLNLYGLKFINGKGSNGGAIENKGTLKIFNSKFEKNSGTYGGSIYNTKNLEVYDTSFNRNSAFEGGAIYNIANVKLSNSNFTSQSVTHKAGVIYSNGKLDIDNCIFKLTTGADEGGAIFVNGGTSNISSSKFLSNKALSYGGGIDNAGIMILENCEFDGNTGYGAGAIDNGGNLTIINSIFTNNKVTINGGAIDNNRYLNVTGSVFENNSAGENGGAILARSNTTLSHCSIVNNTDSHGYAIFSREDHISLDNNWWGLNNPKFEEIVNVELSDDFRWIIMNFTNTTPLKQSSESERIVSFNQTTDKGNNLYWLEDSSKMPNIKGNIVIEGNNGKTILKATAVNGTLLKSIYLRVDKNITAIIHNQSITLDILENDDEDEKIDDNSEDNEDIDYNDDNDNGDEDNANESDDSKTNNSDAQDFSKEGDFNLTEFKNKDFTKSIQSKSINPNLENLEMDRSNKEIDDKDEGDNDKNNAESNDSSDDLTYLLPVAGLLLALFIIFALKRKKDNEDED